MMLSRYFLVLTILFVLLALVSACNETETETKEIIEQSICEEEEMKEETDNDEQYDDESIIYDPETGSDLNGDGIVSYDETLELKKRYVEQNDTDGDGFISMREEREILIASTIKEEQERREHVEKMNSRVDYCRDPTRYPEGYGPDPDYYQDEESDTHFVSPHERQLQDGSTIWVDGDGDTSVDLDVGEGGGWIQSNPSK